MSTVIYTRSARPNQAWLSAQETECREYAARQDLSVTRVYSDVGHSRAGLAALREDAERGDLDTLLVYNAARLGPTFIDYLLHTGDLRTAGIAIHTVVEGSLADPPGLGPLLFEIALLDARRIDEDLSAR